MQYSLCFLHGLNQTKHIQDHTSKEMGFMKKGLRNANHEFVGLQTIRRMYFAMPLKVEHFYLSIILISVAEATLFANFQTVNNAQHNTYKNPYHELKHFLDG